MKKQKGRKVCGPRMLQLKVKVKKGRDKWGDEFRAPSISASRKKEQQHKRRDRRYPRRVRFQPKEGAFLK